LIGYWVVTALLALFIEIGGEGFRKNAAQALKDARATPAEIAEVIGHEKGFTLSVDALIALPVERLQELVERIRFDALRLDHLHV
jgi:hypothetical protein